MATKQNRCTELLTVVADFDSIDSIASVNHDNPDPDAISAGWGLQQRITEKLKREALQIGGGDSVPVEKWGRIPRRKMTDRLKGE